MGDVRHKLSPGVDLFKKSMHKARPEAGVCVELLLFGGGGAQFIPLLDEFGYVGAIVVSELNQMCDDRCGQVTLRRLILLILPAWLERGLECGGQSYQKGVVLH